MSTGESSSQAADREEIRGTIRRAFELAQQSGKPDWDRMTLPVLKNRLLFLTDKSFNESKYGVTSLTEFARLFPEDLELNETVIPREVRFLDANRLNIDATPITRTIIRRDLWTAILDFKRTEKYIWDTESDQAKLQTGEDGDDHILPTITPEEMDNWRSEFVEQNSGSTGDGDRLTEWYERRYPVSMLPPKLRGKWSAVLFEKVATIARKWFERKKLDLPTDLTTEEVIRKPIVHTTPELVNLRDLVVRAVRSMTAEELNELRLPPAAFLRSSSKYYPRR